MRDIDKLALIPDEIRDKLFLDYTKKELTLVLSLDLSYIITKDIYEGFRIDMDGIINYIKSTYCEL